jgi:SAM-dependent methyltransferase
VQGGREGGRKGALRAGGRELRLRYTAADLRVLSPDEASRFVPGSGGDPQADADLAWNLLYRLEPELYDRLASAERLHPGILGWLPRSVNRITEIAAGTGRLTIGLIDHAREIVAVEPAAPLRRILKRKLAEADPGGRVQVIPGFFDDVPLPADSADLVVACSAFTPAPEHGGEAGLSEMERVCKPGGRVAIVWPNNLDWLAARGYRYVSFPGPMCAVFTSAGEAAELAEIFFPSAAAEVRRRGQRQVPFDVLGINPPRDIAYKDLLERK